MPELNYPTGTKLQTAPADLAMDMAVNIPGSARLETHEVVFLEPTDQDHSKIVNWKGRIEVVRNYRLRLWK